MKIKKKIKKLKILINKKKVNKIFIGADALTRNGIVNKVGSGAIAKLAMINKIPLYIIADSWKYSKNKVPMETRKLNEIWEIYIYL